MKFYKCNKCGNIIEMIHDSGVKPFCCGEEMSELIANTSDGAHEKHVPVIEEFDNKVVIKVGEVIHPMLEAHYIEWIIVHTDRSIMRKHLKPFDEPIAEFALKDDEIVLSAYAYCNLHGLWKKISE